MLEEAQIQAAEHGLDPANMDAREARGLKRKGQWPGGVVPYTIHQSASKKSLSFRKIPIMSHPRPPPPPKKKIK